MTKEVIEYEDGRIITIAYENGEPTSRVESHIEDNIENERPGAVQAEQPAVVEAENGVVIQSGSENIIQEVVTAEESQSFTPA